MSSEDSSCHPRRPMNVLPAENVLTTSRIARSFSAYLNTMSSRAAVARAEFADVLGQVAQNMQVGAFRKMDGCEMFEIKLSSLSTRTVITRRSL